MIPTLCLVFEKKNPGFPIPIIFFTKLENHDFYSFIKNLLILLFSQEELKRVFDPFFKSNYYL